MILKPYPGTVESIVSGCTCPPAANRFGEGYLKSENGQAACYLLRGNCPIHSIEPLTKKGVS